MSDLNQCSFIGRLGKDPEVKTMQSGDKVANLSIAVSEKWKDKQSGEKKESTTWVPIVIWGPLAGVAEKWLKKGALIYVQGKFRVRKWQDQSGQDRWSTEILLQGPNAVLKMLGGGADNGGQSRETGGNTGVSPGANTGGGFADDLDDDIPF